MKYQYIISKKNLFVRKVRIYDTIDTYNIHILYRYTFKWKLKNSSFRN